MPSNFDKQVHATARAVAAEPGRLDARAIQGLLGAATRAFAARCEAGADFDAFAADGPTPAPTPTDVVVTVSAMLKSAGIELFELGLWQTWGAMAKTRRQADDSN